MGGLFLPDPDSPLDDQFMRKEGTHSPGESKEEGPSAVAYPQMKGTREIGTKGKRKAPNDAPNPGKNNSHPVTQYEIDQYTGAKNQDKRGSKNERLDWPELGTLVGHTTFLRKLGLTYPHRTA